MPGVGNLDRVVDHLHHAVAGALRARDHVEQVFEARERIEHHLRVHEEGEEVAEGDAVLDEHVPAHADHDVEPGVVEEGARGRVERVQEHAAQDALAERRRLRVKLRRALLAQAETVDEPDALDVLDELRVHVRVRLAHRLPQAGFAHEVPAVKQCEQQGWREHDEREDRLQVEHHRAHRDERDDGEQPLLRAVDDHALHVVHLARHTPGDVAGAARVVVGDLEVEQARVQVAAQRDEHLLLQRVVHANARPVEEFAQEKAQDDQPHAGQDDRALAVLKHIVHHAPDDLGERHAEERAAHGQQEHEGEVGLELEEVGADELDGAHDGKTTARSKGVPARPESAHCGFVNAGARAASPKNTGVGVTLSAVAERPNASSRG